MSGPDGQVTAGDPAEAPLTLELLADLHAGVFDERVAARLRSRVAADAEAGRVLAALDATVAELHALPQQRDVRMPGQVAAGLDAALETEFRRAGHRTARRRHRIRWAGAAGLAAAAAVTGVLALAGLRWETAGTPQAGDAFGSATGVHPAEPYTLTRANLGGALDKALGSRDYGPLSAPQKLQSCLGAAGAPAAGDPLGALEVTLNGRPGVLLVLPTGQIGQVRLLVVAPNCGPHNPSPLADYLVGR